MSSEPNAEPRETIEVDVLIVGGGCAGLATAYHLAQLSGSPGDISIAVLEKASEIGAHSLSGAVMNPIALRELIPDYKEKGCPISCTVQEDAVYFLTEKMHFKFPVTPPPFHNVGHELVSISQMNRWLASQCESLGVHIFPGFAAVEALYEGTESEQETPRIVGVRTGDKGRDQNGQPKSNFERGMDFRAKVTIFAEGTRGSLFRQVARRLQLTKGREPDVYEEGVKEIVQMPAGTVTPGRVVHTMGWPLKESMGGTFIYTLPNDQIAIGLVGFLDTKDPLFDPHRELQKWKTHPFMRNLLQGGRVISYGGKTIPAGGWFSVPQLAADGLLVVGDSAHFVDVKRLKGVHLAIKSGMLAAEAAHQALQKNDYSKSTLSVYEEKVKKSYIRDTLWETRNFHQTLSRGYLQSIPSLMFQEVTGGRPLLKDRLSMHPDSKTTLEALEMWGPEPLNEAENQLPPADGVLFFDKLGSVFLSGTQHDENSPCHLQLQNPRVCSDICAPRYKSPCTHFCPAAVYEMLPAGPNASDGLRLQINFTNCIHCKTCDIKCPEDNILWTPPEGGGGPQYRDL